MSIQTFSITDLIPHPIEVRGMLDVDSREYVADDGGTRVGLSPRRLPDWTRMQLPQNMDVIVRMPSGVRLRFNTNATRLGLEFFATNLVNPGAVRRDIPFNLEVDGRLLSASSSRGNAIHLDPANPAAYKMERGSPDTVWFDTLPEGEKRCELWLPHNAFMELRALHLNAQALLTTPEPDARVRWTHYGSSISHCMESEEPGLIWPAVAARQAGADLHNLGFGGQCHLDQFVARTIRDSDAQLISIKTGINVINMDSMRERVFVPALHGFIDTIREGKPDTPIVLISPIFCPSAETSPGPTRPNSEGRFVTEPGHATIRDGCLTLERTRTLIAQVVSDRQAAGDSKLEYLDGLELFGAADASDLPDDLHPNPEGYVRMGERFAPVLARCMQRVERAQPSGTTR